MEPSGKTHRALHPCHAPPRVPDGPDGPAGRLRQPLPPGRAASGPGRGASHCHGTGARPARPPRDPGRPDPGAERSGGGLRGRAAHSIRPHGQSPPASGRAGAVPRCLHAGSGRHPGTGPGAPGRLRPDRCLQLPGGLPGRPGCPGPAAAESDRVGHRGADRGAPLPGAPGPDRKLHPAGPGAHPGHRDQRNGVLLGHRTPGDR